MKTENECTSHNRFSLSDEQVPGGVLVHYVDGEQEILHVNKFLVDLFECDSAEELIALAEGSFKHLVFAEDLAEAQRSLKDLAGEPGSVGHVHYRIKTRAGRLVVVDDYNRVEIDPLSNRPVAYAFVVEVARGGSVDWLTGLPSMIRFHELAHAKTSAWVANGVRYAAVALDIMGMKGYNTRFGRMGGDRLLRSFATALRRSFGVEFCSRFSEDHFYAFGEVDGIEDKVNDVFAEFRASQTDVALPARAGIYVCDPDDDIVELGFDRAKIACDLDRLTWQSHITWFTDQMRANARLHLHVLGSLDQAIAEGWIRPYYQAIVRSATGDVCGEEALARWVDPLYGELRPAQFIPDLEEAGLLQHLDMHMVDCALADMVTKQQNGVSIVPVSVNISLHDLKKIDIAYEVAKRADAMGVAHDLLRIEFTESAATTDPDYLKEQVEKLHAQGFEVWMDDFGSGYSSLNTIQEFDFDVIKFDMGFLNGKNFEKSKVILEASVRAAGKMGVGTIAEGVETEAQAIFLEEIGCDMLQGYYYDGPNSLQAIINSIKTDSQLQRERYDESVYWDTVSLLSFTDLGESEDRGDVLGVGLSPLTELPVGVIEKRAGVWRVLRTNRPFDEFLDKRGILSAKHSNLRANAIEGELDEEFLASIDRCTQSEAWERAAGRLEYGSGYQFYVRHIASVAEAKAFMVAAMPTMLGSALGTYGDVPVAYAVFKVQLNDDETSVVDTEYVYANEMYCTWLGCSLEEIIGKSFLGLYDDASKVWLPYCYRAVVLGEHVHDVIYAPEVGHWLSFNIVPSPIEGCCIYAFTIADDERRERDEIIAGRDTSDFIIGIADTLSGAQDYQDAVNHVLKMIAEVISPDRLYVLERGEATTSNTFEWCARGVEPRIDSLQAIPNDEFSALNSILATESAVEIPDISLVRDVDPSMYERLQNSGVTHAVTIPFYSKGELLGYLGADNFALAEGLDTMRLLRTAASFIGARTVNHRLVRELEQMGLHDALTGLYNRRGIDMAIERFLTRNPGAPYVLVLMDVDDFKTVNDLHGHEVGDEALRAITRLVQEVFPEGTILGRNGGDEFLAMFVNDEAAHAAEYLQRINESDVHCVHQGERYGLSMSMGYVESSQVTDLKQAYSMADAALYAVKLGGKAGYLRYAPHMESQYRSQLGFTPRDIAENIPGAIVVHKPEAGEILFANEEAIALFECVDLEDFIAYTGGVFAGMVHPDDRERVSNEMARQISARKVGEKGFVDYRILTKGGDVRHVADNGRLVAVDGVGEVLYELIVDRDERMLR